MFRMNENLLEYKGDDEQQNTGVIEISQEAISDEDKESLGLSVAKVPEFSVVETGSETEGEMIDASSGRWNREALSEQRDGYGTGERVRYEQVGEDDIERARREARAAYSSKERVVVDAEIVDDANAPENREGHSSESEAPYVDVEVMQDEDPESEGRYAQVDVVPEDAKKEADMKDAGPGRWKREAREEWVAGGGFFGGPAWDMTKKIFGGIFTGLVTAATFLGGWIVDMFEGFAELFTKKPQKK